MAGDWIKWTKGLTRKPETVAIAATLKVDRRFVAGCLMELWEWTDDNTDDGHIDGVGGQFVDELVRVPGFFSAMISVNWAKKRRDGITIPNFDRHNSNSAKRRALDAERKGRVRNMSVSDADTKRTREEKRRKEKRKSKSASEALAPGATAKGDRRGDGDQPKRRKKPEYSPEFDRAWAAYGHKGTKGNAVKPFDAAVKIIAGRPGAPTDATQWLTERTDTYAMLHDAGNEKKYRLDYERWLKGKGYDFNEDEMRRTYGGSTSSSLEFMREQTKRLLDDQDARLETPRGATP